jgi:hypothetical protein
VLLHFVGEEIDVVPIQIVLANCNERESALHSEVFFVESEMEEARVSEHLANLCDKIGAYLVIDGS